MDGSGGGSASVGGGGGTVVDRDSVKVIASVSPIPIEISEQVAKFVDGDPIADKKNPFKVNGSVLGGHDEPDNYHMLGKGRVILTTPSKSRKSNGDQELDPIESIEDDDDGDISTEDVLNQSKYVKTYIKNPDAYFTLDTDNIKRIQREERSNKPIPLRRRLLLNNQPPQSNKITKKRWIADKYSVYPDLADIKVRVGAASDPDDVEYYNPAEVKFNAAQFDDRFKKIAQFGSQDDIDTIAEKTEALDGDSTKEREQIISNNLQAEPKNKSYTNTVSSKEFQSYLKAKGLALIPVAMRNGNGKVPGTEKGPSAPKQPVTVALRSTGSAPVTSVNGNKKPSVFHRLLSRNRIPIRGAPHETPQLMHAHHQMNRRTAPPQQIIANYSGSTTASSPMHDRAHHNYHHPVQRHSTPIKSTAATAIPSPIHRQQQSGLARDTADNNLTNTVTPQLTPTRQQYENIYESTDRLRNQRLSTIGAPDDNSVVLRNPQRVLSMNNSVANNTPNNINQNSKINNTQRQLRSMPRNEIYAHLYAFYQKSKRNSVSSDTLAGGGGGRSQSRNSG